MSKPFRRMSCHHASSPNTSKAGRIATAALLAALASIAVAACGGGGGSTSGSSSGGTLTIGSDIPFPPFEQGRPGHYTGFEIELGDAIAKKMGRNAEFEDTSFETIFRDLAQGKFEAVLADTTITPEREKTVSFSEPYYEPQQAIVVKEGSTIKSLAELEGKVIGAQQGSTGMELAKEESNAGEIRPYSSTPDAVNALKDGTIEAAVIDSPAAQTAVEEAGGVQIAEVVETGEKAGMVVAKGNTALLEEINRALAELKHDETYTKLYEKWFHTAPPKSLLDTDKSE